MLSIYKISTDTNITTNESANVSIALYSSFINNHFILMICFYYIFFAPFNIFLFLVVLCSLFLYSNTDQFYILPQINIRNKEKSSTRFELTYRIDVSVFCYLLNIPLLSFLILLITFRFYTSLPTYPQKSIKKRYFYLNNFTIILLFCFQTQIFYLLFVFFSSS